MAILKRKNKLDIFKDKTPIFFEQENHKDDIIFEIRRSDFRHNWRPTVSEKLDLNRNVDNWTESGYSSNLIISNYGIINNISGIIAIVLRRLDGRMEIYCGKSYFEDNVSHKKYINKFATNNGLSVRKNIYYIEKEIINSWISPLTIGLEFYDENVQSETSRAFFDKMKIEYPLIEEVSGFIPAGIVNIPIECLAC